MPRAVTRMKPEGLTRSFRVGAFDTETRGLDGTLQLCQVYISGWEDAKTFDTGVEVLYFIFNLPKETLTKTIFFAHNAEYDWRYIIRHIVEQHGYKIEARERAAGKFYELRILDPNHLTPKGQMQVIARFRDSMAFFPFGLKEFTKQFAKEYEKQDIGLGSGVEFDKDNPVHMKYATDDVKGLVKAIERFDELIYNNFKVHVKATASSTAYSAWLRHAPEGEYHDRQPDVVEAFLRKCYHGGLVGLNAGFRLEYPKVNTLDINSSYPANMKLGVPKGKGYYTEGPNCFQRDFPGFYKTTATVPDDAILPIVPYRSPDGNLAWQTGTFESYLSSVEIIYCESLGVKFKIHEGIWFPGGLTYCFNDFVDVCEKLRTEHKGTETEIVVKLMQNSLYGRFGMRPDGRECLIADSEIPPMGMGQVHDSETGEPVPYAFYKPVIREAEYMLPHYAAWITANARILIDQATEKAGRDNVLYRDTDSIHTIGPLEGLAGVIGVEYGKLKLEKPKTNVIYHAPKCYTYTDDKGISQAVYKGIPRSMVRMPDPIDLQYAIKVAARNTLIGQLHNGEQIEVTYHSSTSLQTNLRTGKMYVNRKRRPTDPFMVYGHAIINDKFRPRKAVQNG